MSEPQTIDLTPTWSGILPALLAVVDNLGNKPHLSTGEAQSLREAKLNLTKMSVMADQFKTALRHLDTAYTCAEASDVMSETDVDEIKNFLNRYDPEQYKKAG
jgi:hypothetical protein